MRLSPARFNAFLSGIGQRVKWRRAFRCPNVDAHSGASNLGCQVCDSLGWFWDAVGTDCVVGVPSQTQQRKFLDPGQIELGDMIATIGSDQPCYAMGQHDRLLLLNSSSPFQTVLTKGDNDELLGTIVSIGEVFWLNSNQTATVTGGIPTVNSDGTLTWPVGQTPPPDGQQYTVIGVRQDEFYLYQDLPSDRNEHSGAALPKRVHLRKFDLFGRV